MTATTPGPPARSSAWCNRRRKDDGFGAAGGVDLEHLAPELVLRRPDVADAREELLEIGAGAALFEFLVVEDEALDEVVAELLRGPDTEPGAPVRLHPIADRDDDIEGVEFDFPGDLALNCCKKCNSCFPLQFTFVEDVLDVVGDDGLIPLE